MKLLAVYTTVDRRETAQALGRSLVERKLAACVQISEIESFYAWQGAVQNDREFRLLVKTTEERYADVEAAIRALHPYELPAIHAVAMEHADGRYAAWVEAGSSRL